MKVLVISKFLYQKNYKKSVKNKAFLKKSYKQDFSGFFLFFD
jgi:hypothetical protein